MMGINPLQFDLLDKRAVVRSDKLETWISTGREESLTSISANNSFGHKGDNLL